MILGIPNVGKSSLINRISKKTSAGVGNKPGFTKQKQWIRVSNDIELLDTPGVLWPKFESEEVALNLSFTGTIKDEVLEKTEIAFYLVKWLLENEESRLLERYKLTKEDIEGIKENVQNPNEQIAEIINQIAKKRGAIVSGGNIDEEKVAGIIIDDFRSGKMGKITIEKVK
jgi:ribosome biogenesis GTPase A